MAPIEIDPVSGLPERYDDDGYPRSYVTLPPSLHLHAYEAWPPGWLTCRNAYRCGRARRSGEERCDAPRIRDLPPLP